MPEYNTNSWHSTQSNDLRKLELITSALVVGLLVIAFLVSKAVIFGGHWGWRPVTVGYLFATVFLCLVHYFGGEKSKSFDAVLALFIVFNAPFIFLLSLVQLLFSRPINKERGITKKQVPRKSRQDGTFPITIGDAVEFHPPGYGTKRGLVAQLNRKTVKVVSDTPGVYWNVPPELLTKTPRSTAKRPRQLELIKGARPSHELN